MTEPGTTQGADRELVLSVRDVLLARLTEVLDGATRVALVDFPYHRNAGDAAIWAGERAALRDLGVEVAYVADAGRFDPDRLREALPEGPVLLHGGGSVGDLWPWPQALRERVLRTVPDRHVVQLPQSIHFRDASAERAYASMVRRHGSHTFIARDAQSAERAAALGPAEVVLAPDMAFGLGPLSRTLQPFRPVLALARDDVEAVSGLRDAAEGVVDVADWSLGGAGDVRWQLTRMVPRAARLAVGRPGVWRAAAPWTAKAMEAMSDQVLSAGLNLLSGATVVVTDRLHAHILCVLLGVPHVVLDNSYGKIRALHEQWTRASTTTRWADDATEALRSATPRSAV